ncbi:putative RNA-directed DNA polymerase [Arabidopsis thaliana]
MDVLSKLLDKAAGQRKFGYHPRCKQIGLTHLSFADDLMVLSDGKVRSIEGIVDVFDTFAKCSGLKISMEKSTVYLAGLSHTTRQEVIDRFPFAVGTLPVRYLGLPLVTKQFSSTDYLPLIDHIKQKICSWSARFLSYTGRLNLISSILWSICNFWMGAFRLPRDCIREIDKMCSAYLWSGGELNTSKAKIAWAFVCKPKEEGGLGLRSLKEANDVCCLKLIWRIISHADSLWVKWIQSSLLKKVSFWAVRENTSLGSWMWRKILKFRDIARTLCKVEINNGARTSFWYDDWSDLGRLIESAGDRGAIDLGINKHATVVEAWGNRRRRRHRANFLNRVEERLVLSWNSRNQAEDCALWKGKENRFRSIFSTKDTWNHIRTVSNKVAWYKGVWFAQAIPKHAFCMWLAVHNRLSTGDRMTLWNMGVDATCILCNNALESRDHLQHLFFHGLANHHQQRLTQLAGSHCRFPSPLHFAGDDLHSMARAKRAQTWSFSEFFKSAYQLDR